MVVVREGERLVLVNTVRLNDAGLEALDALGTVTDTIRVHIALRPVRYVRTIVAGITHTVLVTIFLQAIGH